MPTGDDALGCDLFRRRDERAGEGYVVNAEADDDVLDAVLSDDITFKTCEARRHSDD